MLFGEHKSDLRVMMYEFGVEKYREISLWEKKNQWEKKTATGATGKRLKMVVGLGVFAVDLGVGLEKVSIFLIEEVDLIY